MSEQSEPRTAQEIKDARRAEGIVNALTDHDETGCSHCGERIDLSGADNPMSVVVKLDKHRKECSGGAD